MHEPIATVSITPFKPNFNGELSWTPNIDSSTEIDLSMLTNTLFNTNPAAMLRLVITASEAVTITFTGSDNYWLADGSYGVEPPVFNLDASQPLTIIEAINITSAAAPGVLIQQMYPAAESGGNTPAETFSLTVVKSGESLDCTAAAPGVYYFEVGSTVAGIPQSIYTIADPVLTVYKTGYSARFSHFGRVNISGVSSTVLIATEWMLYPEYSASNKLHWRWMGDNGVSHSPYGDGSKSVLSIEDAAATTLLLDAKQRREEEKDASDSEDSE